MIDGLVSIIMPSWNTARFIKESIDSVRNQTYTNWELLIVDDCSTDDTLQVCQKNGLNHVNLSVNLGIGGAVQTGYLYGCQNHYDVAVQFDGDGQLTSALNYVTSTKEYKAYYTSGHGESSLSSEVTSLLTKSRISTSDLLLMTATSIPDDCDVLIIDGPTSDFTKDEIKLLSSYLKKGGKK